MQVLKDNFFYHSNARLGADGGPEDEKLLLQEEQKLCRARARRFSHETNRRRKALEERQKQWRLQEERLRDAILQQRHHKVQEATERFQRAHLPPSQRRTYLPLGLWRTGPNMEEALHQIQYSSGSFGCQSAPVASTRSYTPSLKPTAGTTSRSQRGLSAVEAYSKLLLEPRKHLLKSHQHLLHKPPPEAKQEQGEQQARQGAISPSERMHDTNCSGSLSSLDSLENEDLDRPSPSAQNQGPWAASFSLDPKGGQAAAQPIQNGGSPRHGSRSGETLRRAEDGRSYVGVQEGSSNHRGATPPPGRCALLSLCETIAAAESQRSEDDVTTVTTNSAAAADWKPDSYFLEREERSDLGPRGDRDAASRPPLATHLFFPAEKLTKSHEAPREPICEPDDDGKSHATNRQAVSGHGSRVLEENSSLQDLIANLNTFSNDWTRAESFKGTRTLQQESSSQLLLDMSRHQGAPNTANSANRANTANRANNVNGADSANAADTTNDADGMNSANNANGMNSANNANDANSMNSANANTAGISFQADPSESHQVRFVKGILKKQSKYAPPPRSPSGGLGKLVFAKQVAKSIRDSMELARGRCRTQEGVAAQAVRKKIRWLDEADRLPQNYDNANATATATATRRQEQTADTPGLQDPGGFYARPPDLQRGPCPAAAPGPSSVSEADLTRLAWADAGVQVGVREVRGAPRGQNPPARPAGPRAPRRDRPGGRAPVAPAPRRVRKGSLMRPQSAAEAGWAGRAPGRVLVPRPPSRAEEAAAAARGPCRTPYSAERTFKPAPPIGDQAPGGPGRNGDGGGELRFSFAEGPPPQSLQQGPRAGSARRAAGGPERGLGLHCTPTDEEISRLWHGVRSALATREAARNQVKRQNLEASGGAVALGPRQVVVRPGRQAPGVGNRRLPPPPPPSPPPSQSLKPSKELVASFLYNRDVWPTDEGAESPTTGQHHAKVAGSMATTQTWRSALPGGAPHSSSSTTLSLEEQRILQSLDRLNLQLHCIEEQEEADPRGPMALNMAAIRDQGKALTNHKQTLFSVNGRTHNHRRF
uniref:Centrosomal protein of 126 kDa n=1 Tax=Gadus morhua TaxID=8049 RepID=A0A8C5B1K0_GADMO